MKEIRLLRSDEIICRVAQVAKDNKWCSVLLYKDARVDMNILDEVFGPLNWKRTHEVVNGNLFCTVSIWDEAKAQWISKQDVGIPSEADAEKGEASDAFKRACFNIGIGRELYTAPRIIVNLTDADINKKGKVGTRFLLTEIGYDGSNISSLIIADNKGKERFRFSNGEQIPSPAPLPSPDSKPNAGVKELDGALVAISSAITKEDLLNIYNSYPTLQSNREFMKALSDKKAEVL